MAWFARRTGVIGTRFALVAILLILLGLSRPLIAHAQDVTDGWVSRTTEHATIRFSPDLPALPDLDPALFLARFGPEIAAAVTEIGLVLNLASPTGARLFRSSSTRTESGSIRSQGDC